MEETLDAVALLSTIATVWAEGRPLGNRTAHSDLYLETRTDLSTHVETLIRFQRKKNGRRDMDTTTIVGDRDSIPRTTMKTTGGNQDGPHHPNARM